MLIRTERHIIFNNKEMDQACFLSKNLYNQANFLIRRRFFKSKRFISAYTLIKVFTRINQVDYRALPVAVAQQVLLLLEKNWKSFFCANKDYAKNPDKYKSRPKVPKFKNKYNGRNIVVFLGSGNSKYNTGSARIKRGLFQSSIGKLVNADINGAINIARKVIDDSIIRSIINRGLVLNPIQINCV